MLVDGISHHPARYYPRTTEALCGSVLFKVSGPWLPVFGDCGHFPSTMLMRYACNKQWDINTQTRLKNFEGFCRRLKLNKLYLAKICSQNASNNYG